MVTPEETQSLRNQYDIQHILEKIQKLEHEVEVLKQSDAEHEKDIGRWRTGILVLAALGGIATWVLNTLQNLKGFVK